jgi:Bacterial Ig-like domain
MKKNSVFMIIICLVLITSGFPTEGKTIATNTIYQMNVRYDIDREEAIQILIDEIIKPETLDHEIIAFGLSDPLGIGDHTSPYLPAEWPGVLSEIPYLDGGVTLNRTKWFFWIDDVPLAEFSHDTRFVYIDGETGLPTVTFEDWWCLINGVPQWVDQQDYLDPMNWVFSNFTQNPKPSAPLKDEGVPCIIPNPLKTDNSSGLVVNGWSPGQRQGRFQENADNMTEVFKQMGLNTTTMGPNTSPLANASNILSYLTEKAKKLVPCEDMFIYITGHGKSGGCRGSDNGSITIDSTQLVVKDLNAVLKKFKPGVHIYIQIQACHSGQFLGLDNCEGIDASAQGWTSDGEGSSSHGGRTGAWVDDYKKILDDPARVNKLKELAAKGHYSWRGLLYREAKKSAKTDDPDAKLPKNRGRTYPENYLFSVRFFIQKAANATQSFYQQAADPDEKQKLERAYEHFSNILAEGVWVDEEHIDPTKGDLVFSEAQLALQELESIAPGADFELEESIIIIELLMYIIDVAEQVSVEAQEIIPLNLMTMHQITLKRAALHELMTEGITQLNESDTENSTFSEVIPFFQDVWTAAQTILRVAQRPPIFFRLPVSWEARLELINETFIEIYDAKLLQINTPDVTQANDYLQQADTWYAQGMQYFRQGNLIFSRIFLELAKAKATKAKTLLQDNITPDNTPPIVTMTNPMNNQQNVKVNTPVIISFSESMNKLSVQQAISVSPEIMYTFTWDDVAENIILIPEPPLLYNTAYVVQISTEAEDTAANNIEAPYLFSFVTESIDDTIPPESWAVPPGGPVNPDALIQIIASDAGGSGVYSIHFEVWQFGVPVHIEDYEGNPVEFQFQQYGIFEGPVDVVFWAVDNAGNQEIPPNISNYIVIY